MTPQKPSAWLIHPGRHQCHRSPQGNDHFAVSCNIGRKTLSPSVTFPGAGGARPGPLGLRLSQGFPQHLSMYRSSSNLEKKEKRKLDRCHQGSRRGGFPAPQTWLCVPGTRVPLRAAVDPVVGCGPPGPVCLLVPQSDSPLGNSRFLSPSTCPTSPLPIRLHTSEPRGRCHLGSSSPAPPCVIPVAANRFGGSKGQDVGPKGQGGFQHIPPSETPRVTSGFISRGPCSVRLHFCVVFG